MKRTIPISLILFSSSILSLSTYALDSGDYEGNNDSGYFNEMNTSGVAQNNADPNFYEDYSGGVDSPHSAQSYSFPEEEVTPKKHHHREVDEDQAMNDFSHHSRLPQLVKGYNEKVIVVNPKLHAWGAYSAEGKLIRSGMATAGAKWCPDIGRSCRTTPGSFRIYSLGSESCISKRYPVGKGGAHMPFCMFFNGNQGLHGSNEVANANLSHGCVRMKVSDARWLRYNFASIGTRVVVLHYE